MSQLSVEYGFSLAGRTLYSSLATGNERKPTLYHGVPRLTRTSANTQPGVPGPPWERHAVSKPSVRRGPSGEQEETEQRHTDRLQGHDPIGLGAGPVCDSIERLTGK